MTVGTWRMKYPMTIGIQRTRIRPMAMGARRSSDSLDTEATYSYQWKTSKMQRTGIKSMAAGAQRMGSDPKAEANHYMREAWRNGKSLKNASAQYTNHILMAMLQHMIKLRVGAEHQMTTCLQARSMVVGTWGQTMV